MYDEAFVRRPADDQPETHALWVANPPDGRLLPGPPLHWPPMALWEEGFDVTDDDARYHEIHPYGPAGRGGE